MSYVGKVTAGGSTHLVGSTLYGTCATATGTAAKVVTCANFDQLIEGVTIHVKFTYSNTAANPTLNVNSTGAKNIYRYGTTAPSTSAATSWNAGSVVAFTYDGTYWQMNDWLNTDTDNNTTYTFANGTNGFKVTPSGGSAQTVTVTPSIANNVTGTGTSGKLAAFTGAHTIGDGPEFDSTGERFLKEDGTWSDVTGVTGYEVIRDNNIHTWAESLGTGFWPFVTSTTTTGLPDDSSSLYTMAHGFALTRLSPESGTHTRHIVLYARDGETWDDNQTTSGGTGPWSGWTRMATTLITDDLAQTMSNDYVAKTSIVNNLAQTAAGTVLDGRVGKTVYDNSLYSKGSIANFSTNLNTHTTPGVFAVPVSANIQNGPSGITYGTLLVLTGVGSSFITQVFTQPDSSGSSTYVRGTTDGGDSWRQWMKLADNATFSSYLETSKIANNQTTTSAGYALDARQANSSVSGSLGAKIATNVSNISTLTTNLGTVTTNLNTLTSNLGGLKFEHQVKTGVTTSYNSANVLSFDSKVLNATNYNGHAFLIVLSGPPSNNNSFTGCSLVVVTFSTSNTPAYNIMHLFRHGYSASGGNEYPKFGATGAGNLYVMWNATPTSGGSLNIHASMFQLY